MFTGIVESVGTVESLSPLRGGKAVCVATDLPDEGMAIGDSVAV
jgi:riboflavin synthase alpha subunit